MSAVHYESYTGARAHFKDLLDAAEKGRVATVRRDSTMAAIVDVERLRHLVASIIPSRAQVVPEADGWSVYAEDWQERLLDAPNHRDNWGLVQLISFSDDHQLRGWLVGAAL